MNELTEEQKQQLRLEGKVSGTGIIEIKVGKFFLRKIGERIWIDKEDGEGMAAKEDRFEKAIEEFYSSEF